MFQPELSSNAAAKGLQGNTVLLRQEPDASVNSNIFEDCLFLKLTVHTIGTRRKVSADSIEIAADKSLLHISKEILESEELDKIRAADRTLRAYLTWKCVPLALFRSGIYAVSSETLDEVDQEITKYREVRANILVPHFLSAYARMKSDAAERLGILFDPSDYPDEAEVSAAFCVEVEYIQMGVPRKLATVSELIYRRESEKAKRQIQEVTDEIQRVLATQMSELVSHMVERLTPENDGSAKVFRGSTINRIQEFLDTFNLRNLTRSSELSAIVEQARSLLSGADQQTLRKSESVRETIREGFAQIGDQLNSMIINKPARPIRI